MKLKIYSALLAAMVTICTSVYGQNQHPLVIASQGTFSAGGTVIKSEGTFDPLKAWNVPQGGQTRHGDHADVYYQIPVNPKKLSMVFLHGYGQSPQLANYCRWPGRFFGYVPA